MTALKKNSARTIYGDGLLCQDPVAASVRIFRGALVALDAAGNATPATPASPVMRGVAEAEADNADGAAGAQRVDIRRGAFIVASDGSVNRTHVGKDVFVVDDNTVGAAGTLVAGKCLDVTPEGVVVEIL